MIKYYSCISELYIGNKKLTFLQTKENDNSNVIYTELNGYIFMFMGDASSTTDQARKGNYNLNKTAVNSGVKDLARFHNAGYKSLKS